MKILLLGNGFDLYHYFPTRYDNFLHTVEFLQKYYDETTISTVGDVFGDERLTNTDNFIPQCYEKYSSVYNGFELDVDKIKQIVSLSKDNVWFKYFLSVFNKELGWIDFEREIATVIHIFEEFFYDCDDVEVVEFSDNKKKEYILNFFNFFYEHEESEVPGILQIPGKHCWIREEYRIEEPFGSENIVIDKSKIISQLYSEHLKLTEILKLYLEVFVSNPVDALLEKGLVIRNNVFNGVESVITFNYTPSFETLYKAKNIYHLHGELSDKIIIGVNPDVNDKADSESYAETDFLRFKKYYQRVLYGSDIGYLKLMNSIREEKSFIDNYYVELLVSGHSLDVTDEDVLREVFGLSDKIVIVCHSESAIATSINNMVKYLGKRDFDSLRSRTDLEFKLYSDFE